MNPKPAPFLFGLFFILFGGLLLLGTADIVHIQGDMVVAAVFGTAGLVLLLAHFLQKKPLWMLITGAVSLFVGAAVFIENSRVLPEESIGALLFLIIAAVFLMQLKKGKKAWWAIIPGGFSLVMAGHVLLNICYWNPDELHGALFFGGMGLIFGIIYLLKDDQYKLGWAIWPAGSGFVMAAIILFGRAHSAIDKLVLPLILISAGALILTRSLRQSHAEDRSDHS